VPVRRSRSLLLFAALLLAVATALGATIRCATCGKKIQGRHITVGRKAFCSRRCYLKSLPKCATCGKPITGKYLKHMDRNYCSQACLNKTLPKCEICGKPLQVFVNIRGHVYCKQHANGTRCDACGLPVAEGQQLPDKRVLCNRCAKHVVLDVRDARDIYQRARLEVETITGFSLEDPPPLDMVGRDKMPTGQAGVPLEDIQERGFYRREEKTDTYKNARGKVVRVERTVKENISILYGLTPEELLCTSCHELTHAVQARFLPDIHERAPLWLKEGMCQYVAAMVARRHHYGNELTNIEQSPHPAYGRGYRYLQRRFGNGNWRALHAWLRRVDLAKLPNDLPDDQ
jgi:endogenous inhibitor of DNA gyrase (YacG/DUF329 family)